jgi:hypothetical protein
MMLRLDYPVVNPIRYKIYSLGSQHWIDRSTD